MKKMLVSRINTAQSLIYNILDEFFFKCFKQLKNRLEYIAITLSKIRVTTEKL